jgi:hypothetical protein
MPALPDEQYYVYVYGISGRIVYVGKGTGGRAWQHLRKSHNRSLNQAIAAARKAGQRIRVRLIAKNLTETEALRLEKRAIFKWYDALCNSSLGGRSDLEKAHDDAVDLMARLWPEEFIRFRGGYNGIPVEQNLEVYGIVKQHLLEQILDFEAEARRGV